MICLCLFILTPENLCISICMQSYMASDRVFVRATHPHDPTQEWPTFPSAHPLPILNPLATPRHPAHPPPCTSAHCQGGQQSPLRPAAHRLLNSQPLPAQPLAFLCLDSVPALSPPPHSRHCTGDGIRRHHSNTTIVVPHLLKNGRQLPTPSMIFPVIQAPLPSWH